MARTPEGQVKAAVCKLLDEYGVYYFFPATHGYGRSGVPDIVVCAWGRFVGIECKGAQGKTTALQDRELNKINDAGGLSMVVYGMEEVPFLRSVLHHIKLAYEDKRRSA